MHGPGLRFSCTRLRGSTRSQEAQQTPSASLGALCGAEQSPSFPAGTERRLPPVGSWGLQTGAAPLRSYVLPPSFKDFTQNRSWEMVWGLTSRDHVLLYPCGLGARTALPPALGPKELARSHR